MDNCNWISSPHPVKCERNPIEDCGSGLKIARDIPRDKFVFKEEQSLFRYCDGNLNFSTAAQDDDDYNYHKKKISRDPMSHRIIEKRRRDRMNNCLADLSRLIPADYLKKGRGRIEKTEIIEMAIKHMRHLQSVIANSRLNEGSENCTSSPPVAMTPSRDSPARQPIVVEHYRLGYLECLSEAMHFLVEVQGYFAGDSLCVQMINHLHKHCDKILKGDALNFPRKHNGESSSNSSTSTTNGNYSNNSPPLGMSNSIGSNSDDNQGNQPFENGRPFESSPEDSYRNPHGDFRDGRYPDVCYPSANQSVNPKRSSESYFPRYVENEHVDSERISENRSDSDLEQNYILNSRNSDFIKDESKNYLINFESRSKCNGMNYAPRNYSISSGIGSNLDGATNCDEVIVKEENVDGPSQLREMLTSPKSTTTAPTPNANAIRNLIDSRRNPSPMSHTSGCETSSSHRNDNPTSESNQRTDALNFKTRNLTVEVTDGRRGGGESQPAFRNPENSSSDSTNSDHPNNMYKFKNTIKQRFSKETNSKEKRVHETIVNEDLPLKKQRINDDLKNGVGYHEKDKPNYPDPLTKERLHLLDRHDVNNLRFNTTLESENRKRNRYSSESDVVVTEIDPISSRLSFGHKSNDRTKRFDESLKYNSKLKHLSPNPPFYNPTLECLNVKKQSIGLLTTTEYLNEPSPLINNKFNRLTISSSDSNVGIPIFALHSKGSFYIPLTLDQNALTPFLSLLGISKSEESVDEKPVLHPVTISVNFQTPVVKPAVASWKCTS